MSCRGENKGVFGAILKRKTHKFQPVFLGKKPPSGGYFFLKKSKKKRSFFADLANIAMSMVYIASFF